MGKLRIQSLLLLGVLFTNQVWAGYKCPHDNGYFPDPDNCEIYYRCYKGGWDRHSCGPGTVFNPNHNTCDYPSRVPGCGGHDSSNNPPKKPPATQTYPEPEYPSTTSYPTTRDRTTRYSTTRYPTTRYPTTRYPTTRYRTTRYPTTRYPPTREPPTRYPPTQKPPTEYPTTRYRPSRYPTTSRYTPPRGNTPGRDYGKYYCKSDGYFGHPKYCDHFYRCVMTRPILFACAPGTYFDDIIGTCNYKEQVTECDENGIKQGGPRPTYRPTRGPTQAPPGGGTEWPSVEQTDPWTSAMPSWSPAFSDYFTTTTAFPSTSAEIFICPNRCGFYPHPTRCDQFVVCLDFEAKVHNCPPELYFNWQAKTCDYKENVQCYLGNFENVFKKK